MIICCSVITVRRASSLAAGLFLLACGSPPEAPEPSDVGPEAFVMPRVELRHVSSTIELSPGSPMAALRVSATGSVLFNGAGPSDLRMLVVDSTGRQLYRFGPRGPGPGELQRPLPLGVAAGAATVIDLAKLQLMSFNPDGTLAGSVQLESPRAIPVTWLSDSLVLAKIPGPEGILPALIHLPSGAIRPLLPQQDSITEGYARSAATRGWQPVFGTWANGFVIADPVTYRIALYDWDGQLVRVLSRDIPGPRYSLAKAEAELKAFREGPAGRRASPGALESKREEILRASLAHFTHLAPLSTDGNGRLWVVGPAGDSAYADVFSPEGHLGRLDLPCSGFDRGYAVAGGWLAMACTSGDPEYLGDAVLMIFRIL